MSMPELYDTVFVPRVPIVDGFLYGGTYLFVGAPKVGKSFFMAQIGYHISKGLPLWGFSVSAGNGSVSGTGRRLCKAAETIITDVWNGRQ